jgi:isochorismate synthase
MAAKQANAALHCETIALTSPPDPLAVAQAGGARDLVYFETPSRALAILGMSVALELVADGPRRFATLAETARGALARLTADGRGVAAPLALGGFGFFDRRAQDPVWREFPPARLVIPKILWVRRGGRASLTLVFRDRRERAALLRRANRLAADARAPVAALSPVAIADPALAAAGAQLCLNGASRRAANEARERSLWRVRVNAVIRLIERGELTKLVLARRKARTLGLPIAPAALLTRLRRSRAACLNFWIAGAKTSFVGSTPELLVRLRAGRFECAALAGSAPRGASPAEDRAHARALRTSAKNAHEHRLVVAAIAAAIQPVASNLKIAAKPKVRAFPEAFHLFTPISGELTRPLSALELAGMLHPTPAVCGVPAARAKEILARQEPDRGWYAGSVGWIDARGAGEFAVALRSALIERERVIGWAGAGIVAGSDPDAEFAETEDKLGALFAGLKE